jgi:hypothetical protein
MNQKRSRFRQVENTRNLPEPARTSKDPSALEVLRLWILDETPVCALRLGRDPARSWGLLLAEVARTVGKAAFDTKGIDSRETIATLQTVFNNFLAEPAAVPASEFSELRLQDGESLEAINEAFDPAKNHERAASAGQAIEFYAKLINEDMSAGFWPGIVDLMSDIGHFCDEHDLNFSDLMGMAREHHRIEIGRPYDGPSDSSTLEDSASNLAARCGAGEIGRADGRAENRPEGE